VARVTYEHIRKVFGSVEAVRDLTLAIRDGEFLVLVGPSGSGKTTALRMLAGLESITSGRLSIDDRLINEIRPQDRNIAMVFQDYALYPQMTVAQNIVFGLRMRKTPRDQIEAQLLRTTDMLDIGQLLSRKPSELSGGQRQRVALARALVRDPQVFLMDEPLSNLDAKLRVQARGEIKSLQRSLGTTTVFVTHDQVEAMTMGDRIAVLHEGVLDQVGDPISVYRHPANVFVAGFIGSPAMTFMPAIIAGGADSPALRFGSFDIDLSQPPEHLPSEVIVGIRPEHARLWRDGDGLAGPIGGEITVTEAFGRETFIGVRVADENVLTAQVDGEYQVGIGDVVRIGLVEAGLHLFDAESQLAIARPAMNGGR